LKNIADLLSVGVRYGDMRYALSNKQAWDYEFLFSVYALSYTVCELVEIKWDLNYKPFLIVLSHMLM